MIRKILLIITLFSLLLPAAAGARTYKIATVAWAGWSPLHVAQAKGFWKDQGIDVEVVNYDDPIIILEAAKAEKIDLAMDMAGSLVGLYMAGEPVVAIAETNWSHGGDKIIVQKGHSIQEFKQQPLGVFLNLPSSLYFLHCFLEAQGLAVSDFRIVEIHPDNLAAQFIAGRIPVIVNYDPWASLALEKGNGTELANSSQCEGCIPECLWAYQKRLQTIPDEHIRKILKGWIRAAEWTFQPENQGEYLDILNKMTFHNLPDYSKEKLLEIINGVKIHNRKAFIENNRTGGGLEVYLTRLKSFLAAAGRLKKDYDNSEIFNNQWIMEVLSDPDPIN
jgi:NitT/TauT family transport system substrate-binding protein